MKGTSIPSKNDGTKSDEKYDENFFYLIRSGLAFKYIAIL
jgi:hypothetical protein